MSRSFSVCALWSLFLCAATLTGYCDGFFWSTSDDSLLERLETKKREAIAAGISLTAEQYDDVIDIAHSITQKLRADGDLAAREKFIHTQREVYEIGTAWVRLYDFDVMVNRVSSVRAGALYPMLQRTTSAGNEFYHAVGDIPTRRKLCKEILKYLTRLEVGLKSDMKHVARELIARMHGQHGEFLLKEYHKQAGTAAEGRALLAECLSHATTAREYFDKYFSDTEEDDMLYNKYQTMQLLAIVYSINKDFDRSRPMWRELIEIHEAKFGDIKSRMLRELYFNAGIADFDSQHYGSAIEMLMKYTNYLTDDDGHSPEQAKVALRYIKRAMDAVGGGQVMDPVRKQALIQQTVQAIAAADGDDPIVIRLNDTDVLGFDRPVATLDPSAAEGFSDFVYWLYENNVKSPEIEIVGSDLTSQHILAKGDIAPHEEIMKIPIHTLLTSPTGLYTPLGSVLFPEEKHNELLLLAIAIAYKRKDEMRSFKPYLNTLSMRPGHMPWFWTADQLAFLEGSPVLQSIRDTRTEIYDIYQSLLERLPEFGEVTTADDFLACWAHAMSRGFFVDLNDYPVLVLVPLMDLLNHRIPSRTNWKFDFSLQAITVVSTGRIRAGAEIFIDLGLKSNRVFLTTHGFTVGKNVDIDGNSPDDVEVRISVGPGRFLTSMRILWPHEGTSGGAEASVFLSASDNGSWDNALSLLRIVFSSEREFETITRSLDSLDEDSLTWGELDIPLNIESERKALAKLQNICDESLKRYPTDLSDDVSVLAADTTSMSKTQLNALTLVKTEKEVLHFYKNVSAFGLTLLAAESESELQSLLRQRERSYPAFIRRYFKSTLKRLWSSQPTMKSARFVTKEEL